MSSFPNSTHKKKNKRRFSDEQIKSLESIFESESKLEPMKKMELAKELGLQPRQIAIWFQNRRARWKSKQLEQDYCILKANYDNLAVEFESLKQEKQYLVTQMEDLLGKAREVGNSTDGESENGDVKVEFDRKPSLSSEEGSKIRVITSSNNENGQDIEYLKQEGENGVSVINVTENVDGVLTSPENWCNSTSCGLFDQPCSSSSQWWDFWS